ncbi:MAG: chromosome segregation protein SMC [Negativicutes bacterium]|nr:chromosome segregation protein SMC [Negativicutes bacterium]
MLLRKIEIYGFKSFADRCEIEFGPGVTAIVGPNGSGKSNVSDAIRWALGEQSIRTLRGTKTEDVIFAGSSKRRPLGVAEVSLIFDNSDGLLPIAFSEVIITRRAFRTGESEYFINKTPCRLKDIHDLLADTGLGRDSMTVIGQNKIDELLNAKPEERRLMFEEAAGITKYKQRKRDALRKLEETTHNLTRVQDLTSEIESQLAPLAESAGRTAQYNDLRQELTACQATLLLRKLEKAEAMLSSLEQEKSALTEAELNASTRLTLIETERERLTQELKQHEEELSETLRQLNQKATDMERSDGKLALLKERIAQYQRDIERLSQEIAAQEAAKQEIAEKQASLHTVRVQLEQQEQDCSAILGTLVEQDENMQATISYLENDINDGNEQVFSHMQDLVTERNNYRTAERDLASHKARSLSLEKERQAYAEQLASADSALASLEAENALCNNELQAALKQLAIAESKKGAIQARIQQLVVQETQLLKETETLSSRLNVLTAMQEEYEGFGRSVKSILKSGQTWDSGICGAVAQLITVSDEYVTAVEIALGGALQHIVTENDKIAKQAIEFLKQHKLGRCTFLPLTAIRPLRPRDYETAAAKASGAIGLASTLVRCEARYQHVIDSLLGRTIVVRTIDDALRIAKQNSFSLKIVTLDGELLNPGGSITGGSISRREASILSRANEIEALRQSLAEKRREYAAIQSVLTAHHEELSRNEEFAATLSKQKQAFDIKAAETALRLEKLHADRRRINMALATLAAEIESLASDEAALRKKLIETADTIAKLESAGIERKTRLQDMQQSLKEWKAKRDNLTKAITDEHIRQSSLRQQLHGLTAEAAKLVQELAVKDAQIHRYQVEQQQAEQAKAATIAELSAEETLRAELAGARERLAIERDKLTNLKLNLLADVQKIDREAKELRRKVQGAQSRLHEMELEATQYRYELTYSLEQLRERYSLDREKAAAIKRPESTEELSSIIYRLEAAIHQLGPVNPSAIDEYARQKDRYDFLISQSADLVAAKDYLASIIADIDATMSKQFKTAFETINGYFQDTFVRLFGGGQAWLQLLEPANILESGIEIFVQPPGKKQQNLALLSGGERALTVIALLFAFLTYRPAPFSVVDEIDAALDEANVQRFSDFLREYAKSTQFIVVTHRKGTMEVADVMIGITMEESGVSKLLSVRFMDKAG